MSEMSDLCYLRKPRVTQVSLMTDFSMESVVLKFSVWFSNVDLILSDPIICP